MSERYRDETQIDGGRGSPTEAHVLVERRRRIPASGFTVTTATTPFCFGCGWGRGTVENWNGSSAIRAAGQIVIRADSGFCRDDLPPLV